MGTTLDDDARWRTVLARDRSSDGDFVYAVRTTGVYCRPSCPSRRPKRENVEFFAAGHGAGATGGSAAAARAAEAAEDAGYRACLRCRPGGGSRTPAERAVRRALAHLEAHAERSVTLEELGEATGVSPHHLQRVFTERVGVSPRAWQDAGRFDRLRARLATGGTVSRAGYAAGFESSRGVYEGAGKHLGMTPGALRSGAPGLPIRHTGVDSPLGRVLVAASPRGVCWVALGEEDEALEEEMRRVFRAARLRRDDDALAEVAAEVAVRAAGDLPSRAIPLDLQGTAFQRRVWRALQEIPLGETRSYGEVARTLARPGAARAVGRACASNRISLLVPCHRVVRADGEPGGYRWGEERKRRLLEVERGG